MSRNRVFGVLAFLGFLALPFAVLFWTAPFLGRTSIGNDYFIFAVPQQLEFMYALRHGVYPLYLPGFSGGTSSAVATMGQLHHPISYLCSIMPGYWDGYAFEWNTLFRFCSLGFVHWALFRTLRMLDVRAVYAFVLSFVTVYNFRMIDLFRYGASLETYVGFLLFVSAMLWRCARPGGRFQWLAIVGAAYYMIASGHPQMAYFGMLGAAVVALAAPYFVRALKQDRSDRTDRGLRFYGEVLAATALAVLLYSIQLLPFYFDFLVDNAYRARASYDFATQYEDTAFGVLNALFDPFNSDIHGSFAGAALILLALLLPTLRLFKIRIPIVIFVLWTVWFLVLVVMMGSDTPLHYFFWRFMPLMTASRIPGRIAFVLPAIGLLLLTWLVVQKPIALRNGRRPISPVALLAGVALPVALLYHVLPWPAIGVDGWRGETGYYTPARMNGFPSFFAAASIVSTIIVLAAVVVYGTQSRPRPLWGFVLIAVVVAQTAMFLKYATWVEEKRPSWTLAHLDYYKSMTPYVEFIDYEGMMSADVERHVRHMVPEDYTDRQLDDVVDRGFPDEIFAWITDDVEAVSSRDAVYERFPGGTPRFRALVEAPPDAVQFPRAQETGEWATRVELDSNTHNRFTFSAPRGSGLFVFAFPYHQNWRATVNGDPAPVYRANGVEMAVVLPDGRANSIVEFRYVSTAAMIGMALTLLGVAIALVVAAAGIPMPVLRTAAVTLAVALPLAAYFPWTQSLYSGRDFGTDYLWIAGKNLFAITRPREEKGWRVNAVQRYDRAMEALAEGDRTRAKTLLEESLAEEWHPEAMIAYAELTRQDDRTQFPELLQYVAGRRLMDVKILSDQVVALADSRWAHDAEEVLDYAIELTNLDPRVAENHYHLARAYAALEMEADAERHYAEAERLSPKRYKNVARASSP